MFNEAIHAIRRRLGAARRAGHVPVLLPHFHVSGRRLLTVANPAELIDPALAGALELCDGTRKLRRLARQTRLHKWVLLAERERGRIVLWRGMVQTMPGAAAARARHIVISPHPDDAALSLGGWMLRGLAGEWIVLDVFSRVAQWRFKHEEPDLPRIQFIRDAEEALMARLTGAALRKLEQPEAILRGYSADEVERAEPQSENGKMGGELRRAVTELIGLHPEATWYLPLGVGHHIDHRMARDMAVTALEEVGIAPTRIAFYEDQPHASKAIGDGGFAQMLPGRRLRPELIDIRRTLRWKMELARVYWSQFLPADVAPVEEYARRVGRGRPAERLWRLEAS